MLDLRNTRRDIRARFSNTSNNVKPSHNSPQAVFLTDMVTTCAERFFTADGKLVSVEESTEEFPARRDFVAVQSLSFSDEIDGAGCWHRASETVDALFLEIRDEFCVVRDDC